LDLSYCVKDISDLSTAFKDKFKEELVIDTLMNDNASKENILALKQKLLQTDVDDKVIVSFSGHGMVDPLHPGDFYFVTGTTDVKNPAANGVSYAQLEELLDSIPARKKLMLLDACHSGESNDNAAVVSSHIPGTKRGNDDKDKNKAGSIEILDVVENNDPAHASSTDIFKLMKEAFVDIRRNNGAYVLSAAQSNESAGEGGGISNGWFSSCLIEQLKTNNSITVNELSEKVNKCVSAKSGGNQNTDNRQELAEFNWVLW
jgi:Caspase domain